MTLESPPDLRKVTCQYCGAETGNVGTDPIGTCNGCLALLDAGMSPQATPSPVAEARGEGEVGRPSSRRIRPREPLVVEVLEELEEDHYDEEEDDDDD